MDVIILGYVLIALSAALISAPLAPVPRIGRHEHKRSLGADSRRAMTLQFITMLGDQLRIGNAPLQALRQAATMHPMLEIEIDSQASHDESLSQLRRNAVNGAEALLKIALFLDLSNQRGTPLIPALDAIAMSIESELSLEEELLSEIAGARATAVLMSLLPLLILLALHPFHFVFGTTVGRIALSASVLLNLLGRFWLTRIMRSALAVTS